MPVKKGSNSLSEEERTQVNFIKISIKSWANY